MTAETRLERKIWLHDKHVAVEEISATERRVIAEFYLPEVTRQEALDNALTFLAAAGLIEALEQRAGEYEPTALEWLSAVVNDASVALDSGRFQYEDPQALADALTAAQEFVVRARGLLKTARGES